MQFPIVLILDVHIKDQKLSYVLRCITSYVVGGHLEYLTLLLHIHNIWQDWSINSRGIGTVVVVNNAFSLLFFS
jgi:hypothetical protein